MGTSKQKEVKRNRYAKQALFLLALFIVFFYPAFTVFKQKNVFLGRGYTENYKALKNLYYSSQYAKKDHPSIIPDEALESFAGGIFLEGLNPILIVHDQPPLGRYIIALSIFLFDNASTIIVPLLCFSILGIYLLSYKVLSNIFTALIPVGIFSNEPLFINKLFYNPLLEPIQLPFIIFSIYFFIVGLDKKKPIPWFALSSIMLGFVISIRFFILGLALLMAMLAIFLVEKGISKKMMYFLFTLPLSLVVLVCSYTKTLQAGYSVLQIFGIQKYILFYQKSKFILPFSFWDLILFNRWHTWWGSNAILSDPQWILIWPIALIITLLYLVLYILKKISFSMSEKILLSWVFFLCCMLSVGYTSTRYFLPLLPFLYILSVSFLVKIGKNYLIKR